MNMILTGDTLSAELIGGVVSGSSFVSNHQGSITASINGTATNVDLGLNTNDSPSFSSLTLSGLVTSSDSVLTALFVDSNEVKFNSLGTAALLHFSSSIADGNSQVIGTAQATKNYIDASIIEAGAGDITEVNAGLGISGGGISGATTVTLDTGSSHFTTGVTNIAGGAVDLGSLNAFTASNDNISLNSATGSYLTLNEIVPLNSFTASNANTSLNSYTASNDTTNSGQDTRINQLSAATGSYLTSNLNISLNSFTASNDNTSLNAATSSYLTTVDISTNTNLAVSDTDNIEMILTDDTLSANIKGGVVSGSAQIDVQNTINFGSINQYSDTKVKHKLDEETVVSSSAQITSAVTAGDLDMGGNKVLFGNLYSTEGDLPAAGTYHGMFAHVHGTGKGYFAHGGAWKKLLDESSSDTADLTEGTNLYYTDARVKTKLDAEGVISGSTQLSSTFESIGSSIVSGSSQIDHDSTTNFVASEHIDHSSISVGSGKGLSGGGTIDTNRSIFLDTGSAHFDDGIKKIIDGDGVISGSSQIASDISGSFTSVSASLDNRLDTLEGDVHENVLTFNDTSTIDLNRSTNTITANVIGGIFSGSSQIAAGGDISGNVNSLTVGKVQGVALTSGEATQLATIGTSTISATQWGYLGGMDQDVKTTSNVTFASASLSNVTISGNLKVLGDSVEIAVSDLKIEDKLITVASGSSDSAAADGAGIEIAGANESITWNHGSSRFDISDDIHVTGTIKASDDIIAYASSDKELKNNIQPIENPIEKINQISGNSFVWNEEKQNIYSGKDYGVIAQEIEAVLPELVNTRDNGYKACLLYTSPSPRD